MIASLPMRQGGQMAGAKGVPRREPGRLTRNLYARVMPEIHAKAVTAAQAANMSLATYLESLIDRDQVDHLGRPTWAPLAPDSPALFDKPRKTA